MTTPPPPVEVPRIPPWGSFAVTIVLMALATVELRTDQSRALAGAIIGYVAAYWLPARRDRDE